MRTISDAQDRALKSRSSAAHLRVLIRTPSAVYTRAVGSSGSGSVQGAPRVFGGYRAVVRDLAVVRRLLWNRDLTNAAWVNPGGSVVANNVAAPDGAMTADTITIPGEVRQDVASVLTASAALSWGVWFRRLGWTSGRLLIANSVAGVSRGRTVIDVSKLSDGWEYLTPSHPAADPALATAWRASTGGGAGIAFRDYDLAASRTFSIWGAQLAEGAGLRFSDYLTEGSTVSTSYVLDLYRDGQLLAAMAPGADGWTDLGAVDGAPLSGFKAAVFDQAAGDALTFTRGPLEDWANLSDLRARNWVLGASWREDIDQPVASAEILLSREQQQLSIATLNESSRLNLDGAGAYSPLVHPWREVRIDTATTPAGAAPAAADWVRAFHGRIDRVEWAANPIRLQCRDLAAWLQDAYIETERVHGISFGGGFSDAGLDIWRPQQAAVAGQFILPSAPAGHSYVCVTGGETGTTEPTWPTTGTSNFADGTVTWRRYGAYTGSAALDNVLNALLYSSGFNAEPFWYVYPSIGNAPGTPPGPLPTWQLTPFIQQREPLLDALRRLALHIGWDVRMRYVPAATAFRLALSQPDRAKVDPDRTFTAADYETIDQLGLGIEGIRNAVQVVYSDASWMGTDGFTPMRRTLLVEDVASIARYGRRFAEVAEASTSRIDSAAEATDLANAILSDLKDPIADKQVTLCGYFWPAELGDLYRFAANGTHYTAAQDLAVVGFQHEFRNGSARTSIVCRGKPAGGYRTWHAMLSRPGVAPSARTIAPAAPSGVSVTNATGRSEVTFTPPARFFEAELHVSAVNGFTPSSTTFKDRTRSTRLLWFSGTGTNYGRIIIRDQAGNASAPSAQFTLTT